MYIRLILHRQTLCRRSLHFKRLTVLVRGPNLPSDIPMTQSIPILRISTLSLQSIRRRHGTSAQTAQRAKHLSVLLAIDSRCAEEEKREEADGDLGDEVDNVVDGAAAGEVGARLGDAVLDLAVAAHAEVDQEDFEGAGMVLVGVVGMVLGDDLQ